MEIAYTKRDLESHDAIALLIKDDMGRFLCVQHKKFGFWTIPLGKAEENQSAEDAAKQEAREELGIEVDKLRKVYQATKVYLRSERKVIAFFFIYMIDAYAGELRNAEPDKHTDMRFLTLDELRALENTSDATKMLLRMIDEIGT